MKEDVKPRRNRHGWSTICTYWRKRASDPLGCSPPHHTCLTLHTSTIRQNLLACMLPRWTNSKETFPLGSALVFLDPSDASHIWAEHGNPANISAPHRHLRRYWSANRNPSLGNNNIVLQMWWGENTWKSSYVDAFIFCQGTLNWS